MATQVAMEEELAGNTILPEAGPPLMVDVTSVPTDAGYRRTGATLLTTIEYWYPSKPSQGHVPQIGPT